MPVYDNLNDPDRLRKILGQVSKGRRRSTLNNASISEGDLTVDGGKIIIVNDGGLEVQGSVDIDGSLNLTGTMEATGDINLTGSMTVDGGGEIVVEGVGALDMTLGITELGTPGLQFAGGYVTSLSSGDGVQIGPDGLHVYGGITVESGAKAFAMPHPTKPGMKLYHAATESPVSGVEYPGNGALDENGEAVVELPDYFHALIKPGSEVVMVMPRGFIADWTDIDGDRFEVSGAPGGRFAYLVKAERQGADFEIEQELPAAD